MRPGRRALLLAAPLSVLGLSACTGGEDGTDSSGDEAPQGTSDGDAFTAEDAAALVEALPATPAPKDLAARRLADGLVPPTNRWFSGLVFGEELLPVFPLPLSFSLTEDGYALGLPTVSTTAATIMGGYAPEVTVEVPGIGQGVVTGYDEASVRITLQDGEGEALGEVTIAEGWPFVSLRAAVDLTITLNLPADESSGATVISAGAHDYLLVLDGATLDGTTCTVPADAVMTIGAVPEGGDPAAFAQYASPVGSTSVSFEVTEETARTTLRYEAEGDVAIATMPHHGASTEGALGTYPSSYGTLVLQEGPELSWEAPLRAARAVLDLSGLGDEEREELAQQVAADVESLPDYPADTYFGGKALHRDAQLLGLARQLDAEEAATSLSERVLTQLRTWCEVDGAESRDAFCMTYDAQNRGVVGLTPSFGSDEFNDHHFHYGYFLYAAGTLAADDAELAEEIAPVMDALAADIACDATTDALPRRRTFDAYASHSWASGTSPFADGNNQESSSEATTAWAGLQLWAEARGNQALATQAAWMLALEAAAARAYWTDFDTTDPVYEGFGHSVIPLQFGGKRDYATWFSPEPAAALAILAIPLSPSSDHLGEDPERVRTNIAEGTANGGYDQLYGDWLCMYSALGGDDARQAALETARSLDEEFLDDGDTRSYLLAFIMTR